MDTVRLQTHRFVNQGLETSVGTQHSDATQQRGDRNGAVLEQNTRDRLVGHEEGVGL